jgi:hypothetical protein
MSARPIIDRELRGRARLNSTMWFRLIVGLLASLTAISIASWAGWNQGAIKPGRTLFDALGALAPRNRGCQLSIKSNLISVVNL